MKPRICSLAFCMVVAVGGVSEAMAQICRPIGERTADPGCWITAHSTLGVLPNAPLFWHLDTYPTRSAADAARGPRGTVVESLGRVWLLTVDVSGWRPAAGGERVAEIGPLPV